MRKILLAAFIIGLLSNCKEDDLQTPSQQVNEIEIVVGSSIGNFSLLTISNPSPTFSDQFRTEFTFDINNTEITIYHYFYQDSLEYNYKEHSISFYANNVLASTNRTQVISSMNTSLDSARLISEYSQYHSYDSIRHESYVNITYPKIFSYSEKISITDSTDWKWPKSTYNEYESMYLHIHEYSENNYPSYTEVEDLVFETWKGQIEKYLIFKTINYDTGITNFGWIKLSLTNDLELIVHEITYTEN